MATIEDLRATLERHAGDVGDSAVEARLAAVREQGRLVRRRRRTSLAVGVAAVVAVVAGLAWWSPRPADPADQRRLAGQVAPAAMTSLGYTFDFARGYESSGEDRLVLSLPAGDTPVLVSWASDDPAETRVSVSGGLSEPVGSGAFGDFQVFPPGVPVQAELKSDADGGIGLGFAVYRLSGAAPGVTGHGQTYRAEVAGAPLVAAEIGAPGAVELARTLPDRPVDRLVVSCTGAPATYTVRLSLDGVTRVWGECEETAPFDPGAGTSSELGDANLTGPHRIRVWLTRGDGPGAERVRPGELPGVELSLGLYGAAPTRRVSGFTVPRVQESGGHRWELSRASAGTGASPVTLPASAQPRVLWFGLSTHEQLVRVEARADGRTVAEIGFGGGGTAAGSAPVPGGTGPVSVSLSGARPADPFVVGEYHQAD